MKENLFPFFSILGIQTFKPSDWNKKTENSLVRYKKTIDAKEAQEIVQILINDKEITILELDNCQITDEAANIIADMLKSNFSQLKEIKILSFDRKIKVSAIGISNILKSMCSNKTVSSFSIDTHGFSGESVEEIINDAVVNLIASNKNLRSLEIMTDSDLIIIDENLIKSLTANTHLTRFNFFLRDENNQNIISKIRNRNKELVNLYEAYKNYLKSKNDFDFNKIINFINNNYSTEESCIATKNPDLIELYYFVTLTPCYENFSTDYLKNLENLMNFFTYVNENPDKQSMLMVIHHLKKLQENDLLWLLNEQPDVGLLLLEVSQKMLENHRISATIAKFEIKAILFHLKLEDLDTEKALICYQRVIDLLIEIRGLFSNEDKFPTDLSGYLLVAARAFESETGHPNVSITDAKVFAWTMKELNLLKTTFGMESFSIDLTDRKSLLAFMQQFYVMLKEPLNNDQLIKLKEQLGETLFDKIQMVKRELDTGKEVKAVFPSENKTYYSKEVINIFCEQNLPSSSINNHSSKN